ncbi:hypothetical protein HW130_17160 [Streptomyces sp. PKU-EA00015]|uniref:hypothetical protein n=1 Tax=Streptomyces sp. PKU-EA00015 TaxID=2748326 RepID=UPI0015A45717|nr:hypothetical protein [Streptomyces sp. PKU-EA00015]NWF27974.1 hypothetical protein [Streptomyces sp. PKU-EA00015]
MELKRSIRSGSSHLASERIEEKHEMISAKIRGSIMAVTAAVAAATMFAAPTVSADAKHAPSAVVVTEEDKDKDKGDEKKNCKLLLSQLNGRLQLGLDSFDGTTPDLETARTALSQADRRLAALEDGKCLCVAQFELLRERLEALLGLLNASPVRVPEAREGLVHLLLVVKVLQVGATCENGKCGVDDMSVE